MGRPVRSSHSSATRSAASAARCSVTSRTMAVNMLPWLVSTSEIATCATNSEPSARSRLVSTRVSAPDGERRPQGRVRRRRDEVAVPAADGVVAVLPNVSSAARLQPTMRPSASTVRIASAADSTTAVLYSIASAKAGSASARR